MYDDYQTLLLKHCQSTYGDVYSFLHNTPSKKTADAIISEGLNFLNYLEYCTDLVSVNKPITLSYFNLTRKSYGKFTIIIQISKTLINKTIKLLEHYPEHFAEILSNRFCITEDGDKIFTLDQQYIKGFIDIEKVVFYANPIFNPATKHKNYNQNLMAIYNNKSLS